VHQGDAMLGLCRRIKSKAFTLNELTITVSFISVIIGTVAGSVAEPQDWLSVKLDDPDYGLEITEDSQFTESREWGVEQIEIQYSKDLSSKILATAQYSLDACDNSNQSYDLSSVEVFLDLDPADASRVIVSFSEALPDVAQVRFELFGMLDAYNREIASTSRVFYNLEADVNKDKVVDTQDNSAVQAVNSGCSLPGVNCNPYDPTDPLILALDLLRYDVITNSAYNSQDTTRISDIIFDGGFIGTGHDLRNANCF
jgi:hypothetical protein